jgi:hypothetical protein
MTSSEMKSESAERNHILVVHEVLTVLPTNGQMTNNIIKISYTHSVAYPEDGIYGTGVKQGYIEISDVSKPITEARWVEGNKEGLSNILFIRAKKSKTEVRRLK